MVTDIKENGDDLLLTQRGAYDLFFNLTGVQLPEYHEGCIADTVPTFDKVAKRIFDDPPPDVPEDTIERFTIWEEKGRKPRHEFELEESLRCPLAEYFFRSDLERYLPDFSKAKAGLRDAVKKLDRFQSTINSLHRLEAQPFGRDLKLSEDDAVGCLDSCRDYLSSYFEAIEFSEHRLSFLKPQSSGGRPKDRLYPHLVRRLVSETEYPAEEIALVLIRYGIPKKNKMSTKDSEVHWCVRKVLVNMKGSLS